MSNSDSEPQQNFKLGKVSEEDQPHVRQVIEKGKKILPSYDDQALYGLYKRYYCVENIFLNELHMIARRSKGDQDNDDGKRKDNKWISVGRQVRTKVNKTKYNFLEDEALLRRARHYLKNKNLVPERRENLMNDQNQRRPQNFRPRNQRQNNQSYREQKPKQKFVEKVEDNKVFNGQEEKPVVENAKKVESSPVKEQKYKEKLQAPVVQTKTEQPKAEEKNTVTKQLPKTQPEKPQQPAKKEESVKQTQPSQPVQQPKPAEQPAQKPAQVKPVQKQEPAVQAQKPATQPTTKQAQNTNPTHSIPTVQNFDPVLAAKNFEQACNQNSFVLKFIQPQAYPQRISYIRTADGGMKNVQIRVTGTSSGSSKAL